MLCQNDKHLQEIEIEIEKLKSWICCSLEQGVRRCLTGMDGWVAGESKKDYISFLLPPTTNERSLGTESLL